MNWTTNCDSLISMAPTHYCMSQFIVCCYQIY